MQQLNQKVTNATKWSSVTEVIARLVAPITTIILARLLTPEAFGVLATVTMIVSFAQIFTDAGFNKYIIQHEFDNDKEKYESTTVAFWTNLFVSLLLWGGIILFAEPLAIAVGNPGLGHVIIVACVSIPLAAFSSIQMSLFKRDFDFKTLFFVRMAGIVIPLAVTVPLAFIFRNYWALIIGTIALNLSNAILLTIKSKWKPKWFYSIEKLKKMFSFSAWTMIESISIWLTGYIGIFIIGIKLNEYYLGLYKTSITTVGQIMGLIIAATTPILFSSLSRLQKDDNAFKEMFFKFQKTVSLLVMPLGVGIFVFSDFITKIVLGNQWTEAAGFIGIWALMSSLTIVLSHFSSEVYRAKGKPKLSVMAQFLHLIVLVPALLISVKYSFEVLYYTRSLIRLELIIVNLIILNKIIKISPLKMIKNIIPSLLSSLLMGLIGIVLITLSSSIIWTFFSIIICTGIYMLIVYNFPGERKIMLQIKAQVLTKIKK